MESLNGLHKELLSCNSTDILEFMSFGCRQKTSAMHSWKSVITSGLSVYKKKISLKFQPNLLDCQLHICTAKRKEYNYNSIHIFDRPVMHYFFLERFLQPANWFEKRLAYTRSVAASSMVR